MKSTLASLAALNSYQAGSSRAALIPIDEAVRNSLDNPSARKQLEQRLAEMLSAQLSSVAKEYICGQLLLMGSSRSVPALARLLSEPALSHAARSALEAMPGPEAGQALRKRLSKLKGLHKTGVIDALGARRDVKSVSSIATLLKNPDRSISSAAAAALGRIGTVETARILIKFQSNAPAALHGVLADACLVCAEHLSLEGHPKEAQSLYRTLIDTSQTRPVRDAAQRGLNTLPRRLP